MWTSSMYSGMMFAWLALLALVHLFQGIESLPHGAPSMACSSMTPYHFGSHAEPVDRCPFTVRQSKLRYRAGNDTVAVTLTIKSGTPRRAFKGYLIKAVNPLTNHTIGQFRERADVNLRTTCHAATHTNSNNKHRVVLQWTPDDEEEKGNWVVFETTFVETFSKFFVGVESTFRGKKSRDIIENEIEKESHPSSTEGEPPLTSGPNRHKKHHVDNDIEVTSADEQDTTDKPHKTKDSDKDKERTFWF